LETETADEKSFRRRKVVSHRGVSLFSLLWRMMDVATPLILRNGAHIATMTRLLYGLNERA
jgi:hypothetical protein